MSIAKITILSFEEWLNAEHISLFDYMEIPKGIDKDVLTNNILLSAAEFELLYSNPYTMRDYIRIWSKKHYRTFEKWIKALSIDYNPLENYDRIEEWTDKKTGVSNDDTNALSNSLLNGYGESITDNKVNTYDDDTLHEKSQDTQKTDSSNTQKISSEVKNISEHSDDISHSGRMHGNIGVTTSQQMLQSEIDVARFNLYDQITNLFMQEFVLLVYE